MRFFDLRTWLQIGELGVGRRLSDVTVSAVSPVERVLCYWQTWDTILHAKSFEYATLRISQRLPFSYDLLAESVYTERRICGDFVAVSTIIPNHHNTCGDFVQGWVKGQGALYMRALQAGQIFSAGIILSSLGTTPSTRCTRRKKIEQGHGKTLLVRRRGQRNAYAFT